MGRELRFGGLEWRKELFGVFSLNIDSGDLFSLVGSFSG